MRRPWRGPRTRRRGVALRRTRILAALLAAVVAIAAVTAAALVGALEGAEDATVDLRFTVRPASVPSDVMVVAIDDTTFSELGVRWPFPRRLHGQAIRRLHALGARAIVYDVQFTERSEDEAQDTALYRAVADTGGVILATTEIGEGGATNVLGGDAHLRRARAWAAAANLPTSPGGVIRRVGRSVGGLDTMAVRTAENLSGRPSDAAAFAGGGALIDYRGPPGTVPTVSFSDVLSRAEHPVDPALVRGRVVVIGASAPSLQDVHSTPTAGHQTMSGPEIQANAIWTALHGFPLRDAPGWTGLLAVCLLGAAAPVAGLRLDARVAAGAALLLGALYAAGAVVAFDRGTVVAVAAPVLACAIGIVASLAVSYWVERRERRRVAGVNDVLEGMVRERTVELRETQLEIVRRLAQAAESRDGDTGLHIERMSRMCEALGRAIGMSEAEAEQLRHASVLHDVGKIGIPDGILLKPGRLDDDELDVMRRHTTIGGAILADSSSALIRLAHSIALTHHERWDGTGYPTRLAGEGIPLGGRIAAVCDVFDALLSSRPYKEGWSIAEALAEIESLSGTHFDPALVRAFLPIAGDLARMADGLPADEPDGAGVTDAVRSTA